MLSDDQKSTRLNFSRYLLSRYGDDPSNFIELVVTQDQTSVHHFDLESKMQRKQWKNPDSPGGSPPSKKLTRVHLAGKVMNSIFWDNQWVIMIDYLEHGRTISCAYYADNLRRLRQEIARKRQGKLTCDVLL